MKKTKEKKHLRAVFFPRAQPVSSQDTEWNSVKATFVVQMQKCRQTVVILCKTHPDILFCLFGLVRMGLCGGQMQLGSHSCGDRYGLESFTTNLGVEEIPRLC